MQILYGRCWEVAVLYWGTTRMTTTMWSLLSSGLRSRPAPRVVRPSTQFPQRGLPFPQPCGLSVPALRAMCGGPQPAGGSASPASGNAGRRALPALSGRCRQRSGSLGWGGEEAVQHCRQWQAGALGGSVPQELMAMASSKCACSAPIRGSCLLSLSYLLCLQECSHGGSLNAFQVPGALRKVSSCTRVETFD